jgi:hypothetical protein
VEIGAGVWAEGPIIWIPTGCNPKDREAHYIQEFRPRLRIRKFFEVFARLANEGKLDQRGMPGLLPPAVLVPAFEREIRPSTPPWPLTRAVAALLRPAAALRGLRRLDDL